MPALQQGERTITCDRCGAVVLVGYGQPDDLSDAEATEWWDDNAEDWCPVYGEFRRILSLGPKPCEA